MTSAPGHPGTVEIAVIVEAADCLLRWDRGDKQSVYGREDVSVWRILNFVDQSSRSTPSLAR
jgi:hypothetical protein